ncbi:Phage protein [Bacillus thuringiensis serovar israelensis ATCC 35646]|nr:Phage protein [Bacillus thuringiensis serovar israelensis ATCC 35646]
MRILHTKVTFFMKMNGENKDATAYVNCMTKVAAFLLANTDRQVIDKLLTQVDEEEKVFIKANLAGWKHHSQ